MQNPFGTAEAAAIDRASRPEDLFGPRSASPADTRVARRRYRRLVAAVHPDRAGRGASAAATAKLNRMWAEWRRPAAASGAPHVTGRGTWILRDRLWADADLAVYATTSPGVRVELSRVRTPLGTPVAPTEVVADLAGVGLGAFVSEPVDHGVVDGHPWTAVRLPDGLLSLRDVRDRVPAGLDGRDLSWIVRRILLVLSASGRAHGRLGLDSVLVHPGEHGVVLTAWGGCGSDGDDLADLMAALLRPDEARQLRWADGARSLAPADALREYDTLLKALYGPRRFRPLVLPARAPMPPDAVA